MQKEKILLLSSLLLISLIVVIVSNTSTNGFLNIANPLDKSEEAVSLDDPRLEKEKSIFEEEKFVDGDNEIEKSDEALVSEEDSEKQSFTSKVAETVTSLFKRSSSRPILKGEDKIKEDIFTETVKKYLLKSKLETTVTSSRGISTARAIYPSVNLLAVGDVYIADTGNHRIQKFDSNGNYITQWGSFGLGGNGQFYIPYAVTTDFLGNVYVVDTGNHRIQKFDSNGNYITQWGSYGSGNGQFSYPYGAVANFSGDVFSNEMQTDRIQKFDSNGNYITQWGSLGAGNGQFSNPQGNMAIDVSGNIYVTDTDNNRIQKFDSNGNYITQWGSYGSGNGQFMYPRGVTIDAAGNLYVVDTVNSRIQKFNSSGVYLTQWGSAGTGNGQFMGPDNIESDSIGNVYVVDTGNFRIQKFDSNGNYITQWGSLGAGNGQFSFPHGIAIDNSLAPDLVVDSISAPSTISVGAVTDNPFYPNIGFPINPVPPVPVDVTIKNIGNADAVIPANMSITLIIHCPDYTLCGWPNFGANNFNFTGFKRFPIGIAITLPPGGTHTIQTDSFFLLHAHTAPYSGTTTYTGPMNLWAVVDTVDSYLLNDNLVDESDETNNLGPPLPINVIP